MIRVMVVDDEKLLRAGIRSILEAEPDIEVPVACEGVRAVELAVAHRPDVVLLDIRMPEVDGLSVLGSLLALPEPPVVAMLTTFSGDEHIAPALRAGAAGFLVKDTVPDELASAVRILAAGGTVLSPAVANSVVDGYLRAGGAPPARLASLTDRERAVLTLLARGKSNAEIGAALLMGAATAKDHVSAILAKLGAANRVQAAVLAHHHGLVRLDGERGGAHGGARGGRPDAAGPA
ncbi:response regulator transcription factor [Streptomyces mobaraensis NBRC 13819 = DSM 40847]|uniref:LuxR family two component transcriptional regulator n=1 Tax=Streptomyces mobaraensis (strain ATCC 29032 / DSM 40847 / JCM 4168 / NBRC 13819 / NCIMB 11159 / IPCR 16-22) TaxID=1223523 RepID=M3C2M4_STRM1|nr:response regulator transcription factor [Streptomyces mobaraensis]EME98211.1 LuxR family two component transcriptional regulator [Streptomyces mobaraensis NBRC 13819 = DSM 40847]QTT75846.1 response regulator transcription factor [Streptomyces mobaraensis NBRC 13819 = DSM 40847]